MAARQSGTRVTFFISTGRCATQWFADKLAAHYSDLAEVAHEPFQAEYLSRAHFVAYHEDAGHEDASHEDASHEDARPVDSQGLLDRQSPELAKHLEHIERVLERSHYIETGWPAYGVLPWIVTRFEGRVRIVHLYRDPLPTAASHTTHDLYDRDDWSESILLFPHDAGVAQPELAGERWTSMPGFEKCLFWCTELNDYAFRLHERFAHVPWHSLAFEDVFTTTSTDALESLLDFLALPTREGFLQSRAQTTDRWSHRTSESIDLAAIDRFPKAREVRRRLGYEGEHYSDSQILERYRYSFVDRTRRRLKKLIRRLRS